MTCGLKSLRWAHVALWLYVVLIALLLFAVPASAAGKPLAIQFNPLTSVVNEGQTATFMLNKSGGNGRATSVKVTTSDGSYSATVAAGSAVSVPTKHDGLVTGTRHVVINALASTGARAVATLDVLDIDVAPPPTPMPSPLTDETPIADNFDTATGLQPTDWGTPATGNIGGLPPASSDPDGAFRLACFAGQLLKDDPLVMPGQPGASHLHQFWGNTGTNANSTYQSLRTSGQSTCQNPAAGPVNRTAYWMPAMLDGTGNAVKPDEIVTYYKVMPQTDPNCQILATACIPLPNGLRYTFGYNMKTMSGGPTVDMGFPTNNDGAFYWMTRFSCWKDDIGTFAIPGYYHSIDEVVAAGCPAGVKLVIEFVAPNCWDGKNVDVADHRSHLAYANRMTSVGYGCPLDHPYLFANWGGHVHWTTDANFVAGKWRLSSDDMASAMLGHRVAAGSTLHFDYWEAWSPAVKALWQKGCIDNHMSCSRGDLGNGSMLKLWTDYPTHQLVPVPN